MVETEDQGVAEAEQRITAAAPLLSEAVGDEVIDGSLASKLSSAETHLPD